MSSSYEYEEQYERVKRWYRRFEEINQGTENYRTSEDCRDAVYAFFINCYHLKDWIKKDKSLALNEPEQKKVEAWVEKETALNTCGDVCNGLKHLHFSPRFLTRTGTVPKWKGSQMQLDLPQKILKSKYEIETDRGTEDAFDLATECLEKWKKFIEVELPNL